jgi:membrane fusion protein (multidrug efflux system)
MYARVQIEQGIEKAAFAVPQQAVQRDASGQASVLVVGGENKVEQRRITVGRALGERWVIPQGLKAGDRVVAEGFQKTAPGATVKPEPWNPQQAKPDAPVDGAQPGKAGQSASAETESGSAPAAKQ